MKFKKGNKVEVLRRTKEHSDSWFPGRISSVVGDQYIVTYEQFLNLEAEPVIEKVNQENVRPHPPTTKDEEKWMSGDIAEVFDIHCWRVGKVVKVLKSHRFVVRLFGSIQLKEFQQSTLRVRQAWQKYKWVMIGKVIGGDKKLGIHNSHKYSLGLKNEAPQEEIEKKNNSGEKEGGEEHLTTFHNMRNLKRNHSCEFDEAVMEIGSRKRKVAIKGAGCDGLPMRTLSLSKQMDGVSYDEKHAETGNTRKYSVHSFSIPTQNSEDSNGCSVASCSSNDLPEYTVQTVRKSFRDINDSSCDDAESLCPCASWREHVPSEDTLKANVRELELHAYRRTLQALYASGPLSWEQESLLTNLRLSLHISNEEHLYLLKQLLSAQDF